MKPIHSFIQVAGCLLYLAICSIAGAATQLDVTSSVVVGDPAQTGRLSRNAIIQDWTGGEAFPGVINTTTTYHYKTFRVPAATIGSARFVQISVDSTAATVFVSAYDTTYAPNSAGSPNFGFDANYLGDEGSSGNFFGTDPTFFQVVVPAGHDLVIVANDTGGGTPAANSFRILVEGFTDTQFTEPGGPTLVLTQPGDQTVCTGDPAQFSVTATGAGTLTYQWRKGLTNLNNGGSISGALTPTLTINPAAPGDAATNYNVVVTGGNGSATSNNASLTVNPPPDVTLTAATAVCAGSAGNTASVPDAGAGATYAWTIGSGGTITSATNTPAISYTAGSAGSVALNVTVTSGNGCSAGNSANPTINPTPNTPVITVLPVVPPSSANTASGPGGATTYLWQVGGDGTITSLTNTSQSVAFDAGASGDITLTLTVTNSSGCSATNAAIVHINQSPVAVDDVAFAVNATPVDIDVLANDSDPDVDTLTVTSVTQGQTGSVTIINGGTKVRYTPAGPIQPDSFTYTITDTNLATATATVTVTELYHAAAGTYNGLALAPVGTTPSNDRSGLIRVVTGKKGMLSGSLRLAGVKFGFHGSTDADGVAHFGRSGATELVLARKNATDLHLSLQLTLNAEIDQLTGTLTESAAAFATFSADRALFSSKKSPPPPLRPVPPGLPRKYTVIFAALAAPNNNLPASQFPQGDGIGLLSIDKNGKAKLMGRLADGTAVSYSNALSKSLGWPFFVGLAHGKGSISGPALFRDLTTSDLDGAGLNWFKPANTKAKRYADGWPNGIQTDLLGSKFVGPQKPAVASILTGIDPALAGANADLLLSDGGLPLPGEIDLSIKVDPKNKVAVLAPPAGLKPKLTIAPTGLIGGGFTHPANNKSSKIRGVIFQKQERGFGFFLGPEESGAVTITPK